MSRLIKSSSIIPIDEFKKLQWINRYPAADQEEEVQEPPPESGPDEETLSLRDQILEDAQAFAENRLKEAAQECEAMLVSARDEIDGWWQQKRAEDAVEAETARQTGYEQGFAQGESEVRSQLQQQWMDRLTESENVLKQAYAMREQIIQEAEPFLVELSCAIAEKIIGQQLSLSHDIALELIRKSLSRRRETGVITLCVAPSELAFIQAAREELHAAIDSQAELHILPDASVTDKGCVIRTVFGSIDARIDTQLSEIKRELVGIAHHSLEERGTSDEQR
ncbi:FliH/SctL family protein [Paenibacillus chungangensis]|uniref:FliH/SctL family protein n=1 Tax=Paenibacillus chungangensis TaxID=696535 RepID=A0ABW3HPU8_9BACL